MRFALIFLATVLVTLRLPAETALFNDYEVLKVNHELLDGTGGTEGEVGDLVSKAKHQRTLSSSVTSPSLNTTNVVTGIRFIVHWRAPASEIPNFDVKVEARGTIPQTNEETAKILIRKYPQTPTYSGWTFIDLTGDTFRRFGALMAWRVSLLQNGRVMASRHSFTWDDRVAPETMSNPKP